ncbi:MAG: DUF983 domain-containing protein [Kiloniellaceae bacterium]
MDELHDAVRPGLGEAIWRGLRGRCPSCGEGRLFASYLKQAAACAVCHEPLGHLRSDDAAPWLTILVVGHIAVPVILAVERYSQWPTWLAMTVWPLFALALTLLVLPRAKGLLLSVIWVTRAPGSERD